MNYPVAPRTLGKWAATRLERRPADTGKPGAEVFTWAYEGSTCNNGGTPFRAQLQVVLSGTGANRLIEDAVIIIPDDQKEAASQMCAAPGTGAADAGSFFGKLAEPASFTGNYLEEVLAEELPLNFAGCFCGRPHINQKWQSALATIHYALSSEGG